MDDLVIFLIGGISSVILSNILKNKKKEMFGGGNNLDLTNLTPNLDTIDPDNGIEVLTNENNSSNMYKPMFQNPINAKNLSPTNSIHLVAVGLMPAPTVGWKNYDDSTIFYMPNDILPHYHGAATHHLGDGFKLNRAFVLSNMNFQQTNKQLTNFRSNLNNFNNGKSSTPIETWIHWKIPSNESPYKTLIVKKNSIIWWDFNDSHNLRLINDKSRYDNNTYDTNLDMVIDDNINENMNIVVTIMDKKGTYYFLCSVPGHASVGHKIKIIVK